MVDYSDLEHIPITNEQYRANIIHQYRNEDYIVDVSQLPYDFRIAFCQATRNLPELAQVIIMDYIIDF